MATANVKKNDSNLSTNEGAFVSYDYRDIGQEIFLSFADFSLTENFLSIGNVSSPRIDIR